MHLTGIHVDGISILDHFKDAIFQRLVEDQIFNQIPSILITAKGYPDIATRYLLILLADIWGLEVVVVVGRICGKSYLS